MQDEDLKDEDYDELFRADIIPYDFHRAGRRTKCTPETIKEIGVRIARDGCTYREAALLSGISESMFYRWLRRGREHKVQLEQRGIEDDEEMQTEANPDELPFLQLLLVVEKAIPLRKSLLIGRIREASKEPRNWTAAAWMLERMHPDEFGRKTRFEDSKVDWREEVIGYIKQGIPYEVVAEKIGDGQARELFERAGIEVPGSGTSNKANRPG